MTVVGVSLTVERRTPSRLLQMAVPLLAVIAALLVGSALLSLDESAPSPLTVYREGLAGAFGDRFSIMETLSESVPLLLTGAAAAVAFRASLYNLGGEGQLYLGAIGAAAIGLTLGNDLPTIVVLPLLLVAGALGGAFWALLVAVPRALWGTSEVLPTLMLNFVALNLLNYLIFGSMSIFRDPVAGTFPSGKTLPAPARFPDLTGRLDISVLIAPLVVLFLGALLAWTRWGFSTRVVGDSREAARYGGVNLKVMIISVMCVSGALAGLAGASMVSGMIGALEPRSIAVNIGYLGIVVAALARRNIAALIPVAIFLTSLDTAGPAMQRVGASDAIILVLKGLILVFIIVGDYWYHHRVRISRRMASSTVAMSGHEVSR